MVRKKIQLFHIDGFRIFILNYLKYARAGLGTSRLSGVRLANECFAPEAAACYCARPGCVCVIAARQPIPLGGSPLCANQRPPYMRPPRDRRRAVHVNSGCQRDVTPGSRHRRTRTDRVHCYASFQTRRLFRPAKRHRATFPMPTLL